MIFMLIQGEAIENQILADSRINIFDWWIGKCELSPYSTGHVYVGF